MFPVGHYVSYLISITWWNPCSNLATLSLLEGIQENNLGDANKLDLTLHEVDSLGEL